MRETLGCVLSDAQLAWCRNWHVCCFWNGLLATPFKETDLELEIQGAKSITQESNPKSMNSSAKGCNSPLTISGLSLEGCPFRHGQATDRSIPKGLRCGLGILVPVRCQVPHLTVSQPGKSFITPVVVPGGHSKKSMQEKHLGEAPHYCKQTVISFNCLKGFKLCRRKANSKFTTCLPRGHLPHWWPSSSDFSLWSAKPSIKNEGSEMKLANSWRTSPHSLQDGERKIRITAAKSTNSIVGMWITILSKYWSTNCWSSWFSSSRCRVLRL